MINYFSQLFTGLMDRLLGRSIFEKTTMATIDLSRSLPRRSDELSIPQEAGSDFKSFSRLDDYNRDFLSIFETSKRDIIIDYSHKDGHFRV